MESNWGVFIFKGILSEEKEYYLLDPLVSGDAEVNLSVIAMIISGKKRNFDKISFGW